MPEIFRVRRGEHSDSFVPCRGAVVVMRALAAKGGVSVILVGARHDGHRRAVAGACNGPRQILSHSVAEGPSWMTKRTSC